MVLKPNALCQYLQMGEIPNNKNECKVNGNLAEMVFYALTMNTRCLVKVKI